MTSSVLGSFFWEIAKGAREAHSHSQEWNEKLRNMIDFQLAALLGRGRPPLGATVSQVGCNEAVEPIPLEQPQIRKSSQTDSDQFSARVSSDTESQRHSKRVP